jgi:N-acetylmuramoyl-L-alanine amidase
MIERHDPPRRYQPAVSFRRGTTAPRMNGIIRFLPSTRARLHNGAMAAVRQWIIGLALGGLWFLARAADTTVAIDVGHSLEKPGATSARGRVEFEFNRDLALAIEDAVKARGMGTQLIGADGRENGLGGRPAKARGASVFLSVHHDSVQPQFLQQWVHEGVERAYSDRYAGFSLFVSRRNPALPASRRCASRVGEELRRAGFRPSLYHADPIPGEMKPFADRSNGVHYYDNLAVLKGAASPALLLEAGVIVNRDEELALAASGARERMSGAVAAGLARCLGKAPPVQR